jgi:SAM-dependent methyltransferase
VTAERSTPDGMSDPQYHDLYEGLYARAGNDYAAVPWAALRPHPGLVDWVESRPADGDQSALVVACGLGDDAEYTASHGFRTTAFDFSATAIQRCRERFPDSGVDYQVADLFALPETWSAAFDLVVEIRTLQSMPPDRRAAAVTAIARTVRPGGHVLVHTFVADETERFDGPPWPVTPTQLAGLTAAGLQRVTGTEEAAGFPGEPPRTVRALTAIFARPPAE